MCIRDSEETGEVIHGPDMISKGFVFEQQFSHLLEDAKCLVLDHLETSPRLGIPRLGDRIRSSLRSFFRTVVEMCIRDSHTRAGGRTFGDLVRDAGR